jgi:hypothetical protein
MAFSEVESFHGGPFRRRLAPPMGVAWKKV